jgi:isoquinoline 1-oxidoreductase beta subunit
LEVWAGVQDPLGARAALAKAAGIPMSRFRLHALPIGGAFGRRLPRSIEPALQQLVDVARRCPHPVKLQWSRREEDFAQGRWRPQLMARLQAAVGTDGMPAIWRSVYVRKNSEPDAAHIPYRIGAQSMQWVKDPAEEWNVPSGPFRGVTHVQQTWYTETFIDELAHAAARDPLAYRLALLEPSSREAKALQLLAQVTGWTRPQPAGTGWGMALGRGMGTVVAIAVLVHAAGERVQVSRVVAVVDCGLVVHPDTARQQVEGSIVMGLSVALHERITLKDGAVEERNFDRYRVLGLAHTPAIDVHFVGGPVVLGGLGEPAMPPVAPALGNALASAKGIRLMHLPLELPFG